MGAPQVELSPARHDQSTTLLAVAILLIATGRESRDEHNLRDFSPCSLRRCLG
jgi:hypothetical protein